MICSSLTDITTNILPFLHPPPSVKHGDKFDNVANGIVSHKKLTSLTHLVGNHATIKIRYMLDLLSEISEIETWF